MHSFNRNDASAGGPHDTISVRGHNESIGHGDAQAKQYMSQRSNEIIKHKF